MKQMWYVLQVRVGSEKNVRDTLLKMNIPALSPAENRLIRKGGDWVQKEYTLFPGYVFLSVEYTAENYYRVKSISKEIRFLGDPSPLSRRETQWVKLLSGSGAALEPSKVLENQDGTLQATTGVLQSFSPKLIEYDRHARRATVEMTLCGEAQTVQLSIELIKQLSGVNSEQRMPVEAGG